MIWSIFKWLCLALLIFILYKLLAACKKQKDLEGQGVVFSGRLAPVMDSVNFIRALTGYPHESFFVKLMEISFKDSWPKVPDLVGVFLFGMPIVMFNKP